MSKSASPKKPKKKRRLKRWLIVVLVLLLLALGALGGFYWWYSNGLKPTGSASEEETIEIADGETYDQMLQELQDLGFIRSADIARVYSRLSGAPAEHFAGKFRINKGMSTPEILEYLSKQENMELTYAVVTIPEGYWAKQIANELCTYFPEYKPEDFMNLWNDMNYINTLAQDYPFLNPEVLSNEQLFVKLEGYLFPETYYIDCGSSTDQITRTFLDQFQKVYDKYKAQIGASPYNLEQLLTLASIVQFESGNPSEMPTIAGIFYNRLDQNMPLQSSVTVCYALQEKFDSAQACETNTDIDSPYNTYMYPGIPIGPILNPGEEAIRAVLEPKKTDYLYFVSDIHGDGSIHYATTYEEHQANVEKFNLNIE